MHMSTHKKTSNIYNEQSTTYLNIMKCGVVYIQFPIVVYPMRMKMPPMNIKLRPLGAKFQHVGWWSNTTSLPNPDRSLDRYVTTCWGVKWGVGSTSTPSQLILLPKNPVTLGIFVYLKKVSHGTKLDFTKGWETQGFCKRALFPTQYPTFHSNGTLNDSNGATCHPLIGQDGLNTCGNGVR